MRIDLRNQYGEGIDLLQSWRSRYPKSEYSEKVLLNMFYRKHTMNFMWSEISNSFQTKLFGGNKVLWTDFNDGYTKLVNSYQKTAETRTQPVLLDLIENQPTKKIGGVSYADYSNRIIGGRQGRKEDIEEIEFAYLHYKLNDQLILMWSALGGTGLSKIDALAQMSGVIIKEIDINDYAGIEPIIGQLCTGPYLHQNYNPLPSI